MGGLTNWTDTSDVVGDEEIWLYIYTHTDVHPGCFPKNVLLVFDLYHHRKVGCLELSRDVWVDRQTPLIVLWLEIWGVWLYTDGKLSRQWSALQVLYMQSTQVTNQRYVQISKLSLKIYHSFLLCILPKQQYQTIKKVAEVVVAINWRIGILIDVPENLIH